MRRPNRSGSVIKLSGKRRRPYAVRIWNGYKENDNGQIIPTYKYVGYYEKQKDALKVLEKFNESPVEVYKEKDQDKKHKFSDIYKMWMDELSRKPKPLSKSTLDCYHAAYNNLEPLHNMIFETLTVEDLEEIALQHSSKSNSTIKNIRITLRGMYKTALRHSIVDNDLSALLILHSTNENTRPHTIFTDEEINALWDNKSDFYARLLLILIYTGMRIRELLNMKSEDVHLSEKYMVGGLKTEAGRNRQIPISDKILPLLDTSHEYLISVDNGPLNYYRANEKLAEFMASINMTHYFHDTRHTTATLMERAEIPLLHRKLILGHSSGDVTDRYTHVSIDQLIDDINRI